MAEPRRSKKVVQKNLRFNPTDPEHRAVLRHVEKQTNQHAEMLFLMRVGLASLKGKIPPRRYKRSAEADVQESFTAPATQAAERQEDLTANVEEKTEDSSSEDEDIVAEYDEEQGGSELSGKAKLKHLDKAIR